VSKDLRGEGAYRDSVLTRLCLVLPSTTPRRFSAAACSQMSADASQSRLLLSEADNSKHSKRTWRNHFEMLLELKPGGRPVDNDHARLPSFAQLCRVPASEVSILRRLRPSAVYEEQPTADPVAAARPTVACSAACGLPRVLNTSHLSIISHHTTGALRGT